MLTPAFVAVAIKCTGTCLGPSVEAEFGNPADIVKAGQVMIRKAAASDNVPC